MLSRKCRNRRDDRFSVDPHEIKGERQDVIIHGGMDATGGPFAKQGHQLAMNTRLLSGDGLCADSLSDLAGTAADRVVCSIAGMPLEKTAAGPAFEKRYGARFGQRAQLNAPFSYDVVYIIVDAMERSDSVRPADIRATLPTTDFVCVLGRTQFDAKGNLKQPVISLDGYESGKQKLLDFMKM